VRVREGVDEMRRGDEGGVIATTLGWRGGGDGGEGDGDRKGESNCRVGDDRIDDKR
jgi:hypothetical protein